MPTPESIADLVHGCQWAGAILGILGAWWVASQTPRTRYWGFACFTSSNIVLIVAFLCMSAWPLLAMQAIFLITSLRGMMTNRSADGVRVVPQQT
jgi:hypothetical protein